MARRIESDSAGLSWLQKSLIQKGNLENHAKSREITRMVFHIWLFSWMLIPGVYIWPNVGSLSLHSYMKKYGFHAKSREITRPPPLHIWANTASCRLLTGSHMEMARLEAPALWPLHWAGRKYIQSYIILGCYLI
jgi:hypothetical protein